MLQARPPQHYRNAVLQRDACATRPHTRTPSKRPQTRYLYKRICLHNLILLRSPVSNAANLHPDRSQVRPLLTPLNCATAHAAPCSRSCAPHPAEPASAHTAGVWLLTVSMHAVLAPKARSQRSKPIVPRPGTSSVYGMHRKTQSMRLLQCTANLIFVSTVLPTQIMMSAIPCLHHGY